MRVATDDGFTEAMTTIPPNPEEALVTISTPKSDTVRVRDRVESSRFEFYFQDEVKIKPASTEKLYFPVDLAATLHGKSTFTIPHSWGLIIRDNATGNVLKQNSAEDEKATFGEGSYEVEVMSTPMKVYFLIDSRLEIHRTKENIEIRYNANTSPILAVRSTHDRPAGTVTTPAKIESVMEAVSTFGSALKTTSVERSWPTLRGYPPNIEIGESMDIPGKLKPPDTGVELKLPETLAAVFKAAPLAYYLGARISPLEDSASLPAIETTNSRIPLKGDLSQAASRVLQDHVILDGIIRTEGLYNFDIYERRIIEEELPWNPAQVYESSIAERVEIYDSVDTSVLQSIRPTWSLTVDVNPSVGTVPILSHIAEELAVVRNPTGGKSPQQNTPRYIDDFIRSEEGGAALRSRAMDSSEMPAIDTPEPWDTQIHTSLLDGYPLGSNKTSLRAYERRIERKAPEQANIEVHVICNDDDMREEQVVTDLYGVRDLLEFEVVFHHKLDTSSLRELLTKQFDLLHYIGHVDAEGLLCEDGYLDIRNDISSVGVDAFLLNACTSVVQGEALLDKGSFGGIATLYDVPNSSATRLGRALSRLLNRGFTIRAALEIARESSVLGQRWVSLGDGRISLTQTEGGVPIVLDISPVDADTFEVDIEWFETSTYRVGSLVIPKTGWGEYHMLPGSATKTMTQAELQDLFSLEVLPVRCNNELYWTDEISPGKLTSE